MSPNNNDFFDWDDEIFSDDEFTLLDEGPVNFTVTEYKRSYAKSGAPMAEITLRVTDKNGNTSTITDYIVLQKNLEWKLSQFFRSLGLKKHGEKLKMQWNKVVGSSGRCEIYINEYQKDGETKKNNKVKKYFDPPSDEVSLLASSDEPW